MKQAMVAVCALVLFAATAAAHDLFLKFDDYVLPAKAAAVLRLMSGSFRASENAVARDRMVDASLLAPSGVRLPMNPADWRDEHRMAVLRTKLGMPGTYVAGISLKPREITLQAAAFNNYLRQDGLPDTLAARRRDGELSKPSRERYSKHAKAIVQVLNTQNGYVLTDNYKTPLGYPVELIPQQNPSALEVEGTLEVLCLKQGQPIPNQFVMAGYESNGRVVSVRSVRTDANGIARIKLTGAGKWFVKFIHMTKLNQPDLDYESKWASLTFTINPVVH